MKKRIPALLLAILFAVILIPAAFADNPETQPEPSDPETADPEPSDPEPSDIRIFLDGRQISTEAAPYIENDRILIPVRSVTEALGAKVDWDSATRTVTICRAAKEIIMIIDEEYATVNGERVMLDAAPGITGGATYLPLRFVSENFSQLVEWNSVNRTVKISENMSFARENANIREWMIGCGAILASENKLDPYLIGMTTRTSTNAETTRRMLYNSWDCENRGDVIFTILSMTDGGHAEQFRIDAELANSFSDAQYEEILDTSNELDRYMWPLIKDFSAKWGDKGIKAWDWFRVIHLAQWGYIAGYLELGEAYLLVEPIAQKLKNTFASWDEATENYMDGYAYWSRTNVSNENTSYKQRLQIYKDLKAAQPTNGLLFNHDVWTQPVIGVIDSYSRVYPVGNNWEIAGKTYGWQNHHPEN